jgi:hypothetical protein
LLCGDIPSDRATWSTISGLVIALTTLCNSSATSWGLVFDESPRGFEMSTPVSYSSWAVAVYWGARVDEIPYTAAVVRMTKAMIGHFQRPTTRK